MSRQETYNPQQHSFQGWKDALGILLVGTGLILLLALLSYEPRDVPSWLFLHQVDAPNSPAHNLIGRTGAVFSHIALFLFGAAAFLIAGSMVWIGVYSLVSRKTAGARVLWGAVIVLFSGATLLQLQSVAPESQAYQYSFFGLGGGIGHLLGDKVVRPFLGSIGGALFLALIYLAGMCLMTGMQISRLAAVTLNLIHSVGHWLSGLLMPKRQLVEGPEAAWQPLEEEEPKPKRKPRKAPEEKQSEIEFEPEPKIFDSSAPRPANKMPLPSLAEHLSKRQAEKSKAVENAPSGSLAKIFSRYKLPEMGLLDEPRQEGHEPVDHQELKDQQQTIIRTLKTFGINVKAGDITRGPSITRYEILPEEGLRVNKITSLEADLARATCAERINILAPIPGKDTVGVEIANSTRVAVPLRELLEDGAFANSHAKIPLALGKDVYGHTIIADLAAMPHLLVAGATGSGKSVCINTIIACLVYRFSPDELRFIMIDPKVVEMQNYNQLPHMALPVVTDTKKVVLALRWVVKEMERRYRLFAKFSVRNFDSYNKKQAETVAEMPVKARAEKAVVKSLPTARLKAAEPDPFQDEPRLLQDDEEAWAVHPPPKRRLSVFIGDDDEDDEVEEDLPPSDEDAPERIPYIVVIIDELADLMQTAPADVEGAIARITQMARAAGIHMIVATQTPRADVVTGVIKANIPSRLAFQVASALDSRVILDQKGAEKLVGKGDMLYLPPGSAKLLRSQGAFVSDEEIQRVIDHCGAQGAPVFDIRIEDEEASENGSGDDVCSEDEELLVKVLEVLRQEGKASTSMVQRRLRLGYTRAARMMDILEQRGIIGPADGARPREILVNLDDEFASSGDDDDVF